MESGDDRRATRVSARRHARCCTARRWNAASSSFEASDETPFRIRHIARVRSTDDGAPWSAAPRVDIPTENTGCDRAWSAGAPVNCSAPAAQLLVSFQTDEDVSHRVATARTTDPANSNTITCQHARFMYVASADARADVEQTESNSRRQADARARSALYVADPASCTPPAASAVNSGSGRGMVAQRPK
jgi:hypothetical protein